MQVNINMQKTLLFFLVLVSGSVLRAQCENVNPDCNILNDFECQTNYIGLPAVVNPAPDDVNGSTMVGEYVDQNDAYDGLFTDFRGPLDLTIFNQLRIKVYTDAMPAGRFLAILQGGTSPSSEKQVASMTSGVWTEYVFDFSDQASADHSELILIFNADITRTNGPETYFLDDVRFAADAGATDPCSNVEADPSILNDFECQQNEPFQTCFPIVANPLVNADNPSDRVGCFQDIGAEFDNIFIQFDGPIDLTTNNQFSMKVNSATPGNLIVKLEGGTSPSIEVNTTVMGTSTWETIAVDFSAQANENHTRLVLFFNSGNVPGPNDKYFLDDIAFEAVLPVSLVDFTASVVKEAVRLDWETSLEEGSRRFVVEHRTNRSNWSEVGEIAAAGNSEGTRPYTFLHGAGSGQHLYRLRMEDLDGSLEYSPVRSANIVRTEAGLTVSPNPVEDQFSLAFTSPVDGESLVELVDLSGRVVLRKQVQVAKGANSVSIAFPATAARGTYLLRMTDEQRVNSVFIVH
ncbi:T9SS type A sorting domain-containing protein [Lewinella sp. 4G2]|uniref:T9SS type A sorting domain-containing protein n=1 Tax=Lewinella sp. 4G2 TaxID=1803372 RepID=UPI0007B476EE|nr:T9SS type A sorting domain-containing protein [Lewinella sp. 4G2]OAV42683.1 hypothetical protein A3850_015690 [Lewinella sp. 4G2]